MMARTRPVDTSKPLRQRAEEVLLKAVRAYTFNIPIKKGTYRLFTRAMKVCRYPHVSLFVPTIDGRSLSVDLTSGMENTVFFHGRYEPVLTEIVKSLISPGEVCIDAGANFGWYTTLLANLVGESGSVHAFEPIPRMFDQLKINRDLLSKKEHVFINKAALGDAIGTVTINLFAGQSTGHASVSAMGRTDLESFDCEMITLDSYLHSRSLDNVDFVKVDIEGSELMFLKGADRLFEQQTQPIILMEMARELTKHFGYLPNDLLAFLTSKADYLFYAVDENRGRVRLIDSFDPADIGANVFCLPRSAADAKHKAISRFLDK